MGPPRECPIRMAGLVWFSRSLAMAEACVLRDVTAEFGSLCPKPGRSMAMKCLFSGVEIKKSLHPFADPGVPWTKM